MYRFCLHAVACLLFVAGAFIGCRPSAMSEPIDTGENKDSVLTPDPYEPVVDSTQKWQVTGDYSEDISLALPSPWNIVKVGVRVGDDIEFVMHDLVDGKRKIYLVIEYTDTISSFEYHYLPVCWQQVQAGEMLADTISAYTVRLMRTLSMMGADVTFVQLSRNISNGLLWHSDADQLSLSKSMSDNLAGWKNQCLYIRMAVEAIKGVYPQAKIVLQTNRLGYTTAVQNQLSNLLNNWNNLSVDYDVLSLSYNPAKQGGLDVLESALSAIDKGQINGKEIHFETCFPCDVLPTEYYGLSSKNVGYSYSRDGQRQYLKDCYALVNRYFPICEDMKCGYFIYRYASSLDCFQLMETSYLLNIENE